MHWFLLDRVLLATQRIAFTLIVCLVVRQFLPEWWQVYGITGDPTPEFIKSLVLRAAAEQQFRTMTILFLSGGGGLLALLRAQLPWPPLDRQYVWTKAR
ncbi:MAG: hypothetical protein R2867_28365 [Caldilineaceae bacterium]